MNTTEHDLATVTTIPAQSEWIMKLAHSYSFAPVTLITEFCKVASMDSPMEDVEEMLSKLESNFISKQGSTDESTREASKRL